MSSTSLRVMSGIMFLLGVCFCVFYYPTYAHPPSSLHGEYAGADTDQQKNEPLKSPPAANQGTNESGQSQWQSGDKNGAPESFSSPGTEQSVVPVQKEPTEVAPETPENITNPSDSITPQTPAPPAVPASNTGNQLIKRVDSVHNMVAITFDDGPFPQMTEQYLAVLDKLNVRATFFMVGQRIKYYPELARRVAEQGNEIGSHSWQHARLDELTAEAIAEDMRLVANEVQAAVGQAVSLLRPPYGARSDVLLATAEQHGYKVIIWDVDPRDWEDPPPDQIVASVLGQVKPGSIIVMHEGHVNTLQALPVIIQKLRERGLEPVTVSEMLSRDITQSDSSLANEGN
ncbi:polysaccharide deacetylase family protein [Desulfallas thermosapovorans]|uniref:Peptidoglycan/xylan/chitin deacetylase (PgdA/CDA1 family) n=1 Tax=Desulfallas thermosapovorans DSM 6562 TaxID=1121431 RepID=A0A5S4ZUU4_9FIRM|nr:polysaccharide deacetylase family protein [Desulfallas thermosapovorans]TYO95872.1 peptidoglycan/xylan/chitin deacetylase (PgdA/CDA1 family) [Desulfallas thermosapovorans DSM 6562]